MSSVSPGTAGGSVLLLTETHGRTGVEDLLDPIFRDFCIGKRRGGIAQSAIFIF